MLNKSFQKINIYKENGVGDTINLALALFRTHIAEIIKPVLIISAPLGILGLLLHFQVFDQTLSLMTQDNPDLFNFWESSVKAVLLSFVRGFFIILIQLVVFSWYKVSLKSDDAPNLVDVWQECRKHLGTALLLTIVYWVAVVIGTIFFIIPGLFIAVIWSLLLPIIVLEEKGFESLSWSNVLVKDNWWRTLAYFILFFIIIWVVSVLFSLPTMLIFGLEAFFNLADNSSGALNFDIPFWQVALSGVFEFAGNIIYGLLIGLAQLAWYGNRQDAVTGIGLKLELDYAQKEESLHQNEEGEY